MKTRTIATALTPLQLIVLHGVRDGAVRREPFRLGYRVINKYVIEKRDVTGTLRTLIKPRRRLVRWRKGQLELTEAGRAVAHLLP